jgi:phenylacetate-CoA ligase
MNLLRFVPRFRQAARDFQTLDAREAWSRGDIEAFQLDRLNDIWSHALRFVPYYSCLAIEHQLPPRFASIAEYQQTMPILDRDMVREQPERLISPRCRPGSWRATSGSTGIPTRVFWSDEAHRQVLRAKYHFYAKWGIGVFDRMAFLWGHLSPPGTGLMSGINRIANHGKNWVRNRIHLSAHDMGRDRLHSYLHQIAAFRPTAIYAFSGAAHLLALEAEALNWHCPSLRAVFLAGEPAYPHIVRTVERVFQVPAVVEYGSCECGLLAGQFPDGTLRVREDLSVVETVPRDDGRFDIVVSVLTNPCFPLLRYALGDATEVPLQKPARGFAVLDSISGRNNDVIVTGSGRRLHPGRLAAVFENNRAIRRFRLHQDAQGATAVAVELNDSGGPQIAEELRRRLGQLVEGFPVEVSVVPSMPASTTGKHRYISSDLAMGS